MSARRVLKSSAGYLIAAACLAWLLHDVRLSEIAGYLAGARWRWIALALAFDVLSYACQGWRWKLLLEPLGPISVFRATQAIYAGLFTNEVLPMRAGELVRAGVVAGRLHVRLDAVAASILVERLLDAAWLALASRVSETA
jgi:uncharacterized protein (TIRG00374 family)